MARAIMNYSSLAPLKVLHSQGQVVILKSFKACPRNSPFLARFPCPTLTFSHNPQMYLEQEKKSEIYVPLEGNYDPN